jgi:DNA-binding IclR family transcriptional regulator
MSTRIALIIIGTYKDAWWGLAPVAQADFSARVGKIAQAAGITPITGYRLTSTLGAFLEVWEGADRAAVDRAVKELQAMGYTRYVEARWLIGEREGEV